MGKVDDGALLTRASRGDEAAFSELFARYQRQIYHYAERVCGCASGDDIVQETFLAVLRPSGRFDPAKGTVPGYLFGIARHHVIKRLARRGATLSEPPEVVAAETIAAHDSPFETSRKWTTRRSLTSFSVRSGRCDRVCTVPERCC